ncbi:MAG TPA: hypothetical protein VKN35_04850, partial [Xanthomonadales bacterium]|nr:hypothetical protein [Xanthomonadales bacterium]
MKTPFNSGIKDAAICITNLTPAIQPGVPAPHCCGSLWHQPWGERLYPGFWIGTESIGEKNEIESE